MNLYALRLGASLLFVVGGTAAANNHKYPWCTGLPETGQGSVTVSGSNKFQFNSDADDIEADDGLYDVALASCGLMSSDTNEYDKPLAATRARWAKRLELTDADWKDVAEYTNLPQYARRSNGIERIDLNKRTYESLTPTEQFAIVEHGTKTEGKQMMGSAWMADILGAHLGETGRLSFLETCIDATDPVLMAQCAPDAAAFNAHKVFAEMRGDTSSGNGAARIQIRKFADRMQRAIPVFQRRVAALVKTDPAYGKMFELAAQTANQWDAMYAAHDPNVEFALQMDDALVTNSRKAYEGCGPRAREAWLKAVSAIPAKRFAKMHGSSDGTSRFYGEGLPAVLQTPDGYLAGFSLMICGRDADGDALHSLGDRIAQLSQRWSGNRGPRGGIVSAITAADFQFDDRNVELKQPNEYREWLYSGAVAHPSGGAGVVSKVTTKAGKLNVKFVSVPGSEEACANGHFTHRIEAVRSDGTIQYHYDCMKWKTVKTETAAQPTEVDAGFAGGLKAGMKTEIIDGVVDAAWASAKRDIPVIVFGAPVK